ncbi:MAG: glycoside hydrolase family 3 N-terminal domain-containing protein, partial [Bacteroidota bacterium]
MNRCLLILLSCCLLFSCHRKVEEHETWHIPFLQQSAGNVDSVLQIWTQAQKIAQLIIYQPDISSPRSLDTLLTMGAANHFGGVLLRDLPFQDFLWVADSLQRMAQAPLFLATDEAVSLTNQFSNLSHFPYSASLAAVADDSLEYQLQDFFLRQCEATGINFCLSPHLNPLDWADGKRAVVFDQDRDAILQSTSRQLEQLQEKGILSVARHFTQYYPHQADTSQLVDSLLHPYYNLCRNGLSGLMIDGQLFDRDSADWRATNYLRSYLQKRLDFQGLIVVRHQGKADELRRQVRAGAHVFMTSQNPKVLIDSISQYIAEGLLTEYALEERVRKVLLAKQWLRKDRVLDQIDIQADQQLFNNEAFPFYVRQLQQKALTLVNDPDSILPFQNIHRRSYRLYEVGAYRMTSFQRFFEKYAAVHTEQVPFIDTVGYAAIPYKQAKRSTVIISLNQVSIAAEPRLVESINALAAKQEVVLINWAYPNNLALFDPSIAMIQLYEQDKINQALTAQLLFGAIAPQGRLPLDISANLTKGTRLNRPVTRLQYGIPEEVGIYTYQFISCD